MLQKSPFVVFHLFIHLYQKLNTPIYKMYNAGHLKPSAVRVSTRASVRFSINMQQSVCGAQQHVCARCASACLQEVLLHPHRLLLLLLYPLFDHPDEVVRPCPGLGLHAGVEAGNSLQLLWFRPTQLHKLLLRLHAHRQLPVWTGNRKEAARRWWAWRLEPTASDHVDTLQQRLVVFVLILRKSDNKPFKFHFLLLFTQIIVTFFLLVPVKSIFHS